MHRSAILAIRSASRTTAPQGVRSLSATPLRQAVPGPNASGAEDNRKSSRPAHSIDFFIYSHCTVSESEQAPGASVRMSGLQLLLGYKEAYFDLVGCRVHRRTRLHTAMVLSMLKQIRRSLPPRSSSLSANFQGPHPGATLANMWASASRATPTWDQGRGYSGCFSICVMNAHTPVV